MDNAELTKKLIDVDERTTRHTEQIKTLFGQLGEIKSLVEGVHELVGTVKVLASEQKNTSAKVDGLANDLEEIKTKPGKRWDNVITVVVTAGITALVGYVLGRIGLK